MRAIIRLASSRSLSSVMSYTPTPDDPVYTAIGRAISAWAEFEEEAFRFYCELMAQPDPLCAVAFFSLGTFSGKLELVTATIFRRRSFLRLLGVSPPLPHWLHSRSQDLGRSLRPMIL